MRSAGWCVLGILICCAGQAGAQDDFYWQETFDDVERWERQPDWLGNPSSTASVTGDGQQACFRVDEPGRGMKWSGPMLPIALDDTPYLIVRYRAENLNTSSTDYLVYLNDGLQDKQLHAIRLCDVMPDGKWHTLAVDVAALTPSESVTALAVQVQAAGQGRAALWLDRLTFTTEPPESAKVIQRRPLVPHQPDWIAPLARMKWLHRGDWLANPVAEQGQHVEVTGQTTIFRVDRRDRGMKWSCDLPEPVSLAGHRFVTMRYRAWGVSRRGDYALCAMGKPHAGGPSYTAIIDSPQLESDGRWHTVNVALRRAAALLPSINGLAIQVQAESDDARLEVADIRLVNSPQPSNLADAIDWKPGARFEQYRAVPIRPKATGNSRSWRRHLRIADWFARPDVTVDGVPFELLPAVPDLAATTVGGKSDLRFSTEAAASEVYVLLLAALVGAEEPAYGTGPFKVIRDLDRFRLRLEYADGTADECLPMNTAGRQFGIGEGVQLVVAAADESKQLQSVVIRDIAKQAAFAVAALTLRIDGKRRFPEALEETPPLRLKRVGPNVLSVVPERAKTTANVPLEAEVSATGPPLLQKLVHHPTGWNYLDEPCLLVKLTVDDKPVAAEDLHRITKDTGQSQQQFNLYTIRGIDGLQLGLETRLAEEGSLTVLAKVSNHGAKEHKVSVVAPAIGPYRLCDRADDAYYLVPRRGAIFDNRPCSYRQRYCGLFPVQFLDTFCPSQGRGLALQTTDTTCLRKHYLLDKEGNTLSVGVEYPDRVIRPGTEFTTARAVVRATDGDWHRGLDAYRRWVATWYQPRSPRKPWFREIFNFRQRFLRWLDPLYDAKQGKFHLDRAVDEARREFGGIDYLHIFDWGNCGSYGRIYGRTGDYSPFDYFEGGRDAFRKAIGGVQAQDVPVGLYIEGYLLQERGKLGQKYGRAWQLVGRDGKGRYWPKSTEMFVCPYVAAWHEVQASTYAARVRELDVDGMYLDQFGFANRHKDCWSAEHGHEVPSYAVTSERDCTRIVRDRIDGVKQGVALYTEESPVDVTSQYQDGSFTYAMRSSHGAQTLVPLNVFRFALPDFKTIEILYCDKPTGSWATGVKWVFFNGEAIWLEGPAGQWFEPETRAAIRRCWSILHKHRDAFTTLRPVPLVTTEIGGVYANAFTADNKTVYTLYNSRHRTVRGEVLRVANRRAGKWYDEWHQCWPAVRRDGQHDVVRLEIGPHDVGCVVVETE